MKKIINPEDWKSIERDGLPEDKSEMFLEFPVVYLIVIGPPERASFDVAMFVDGTFYTVDHVVNEYEIEVDDITHYLPICYGEDGNIASPPGVTPYWEADPLGLPLEDYDG